MFQGATGFNQGIAGWTMTNVTDTSDMFNGASGFNQNLMFWDTSNVTNMQNMFNGASLFNQRVYYWNTLSVVAGNYADMFVGATAMITEYENTTGFGGTSGTPTSVFFNQPLTTLTFTFTDVPNNETLTIPLTGLSGVTENDNLIWNGTGETLTNNPTYQNTSGFTSTIVALVSMLDGTFTSLGSGNGASWSGKEYLTSVVASDERVVTNWGLGANIADFSSAFDGCTILVDVPIRSPDTITNMASMFQGAVLMNKDISLWHTANVTDMSNMFNGAAAFNQNIATAAGGVWDTSLVTDMNHMFYGATAFNGDISGWNTSSVTDMLNMFNGAAAFNQNINAAAGGVWDTSLVPDMSNMFYGATAFNGDISGWNTSSVTDMNNMFNGAAAFNQDINAAAGGVWDTSLVTDMNNMFYGATAFNGVISGWNTESVTDMSNMFYGAATFNTPINTGVGVWDTSKVTDMSNMFYGATTFNQEIGAWDTILVENTSRMFQGAAAFNQNIDLWDTSSITDMNNMFNGAAVFNQSIENWDTSSVTDMNNMFNDAAAFNGTIVRWDTSSVTDMSYMFYGASAFNQKIYYWTTINVGSGNYDRMFDGAVAMITEYSGTPGFGITPLSDFFNNTLPQLTFTFTDVPNGAVLTIPLTGGSGLTTNDAVTWNDDVPTQAGDNPAYTNTSGTATITAKIVVTDGTFATLGGDQVGDEVGLGSWVDNGGAYLTSVVALDETSRTTWGLGDSISSLYNGFKGCVVLTQVPPRLPSSVIDLRGTFSGATLFNSDIEDWDTFNVTDMSNTFEDAAAFNQNIGGWNTFNVSNMASMFKGALVFDKNIDNWNTNSVTDMSNMFNGAPVFDQYIRWWRTYGVLDYTNMFLGATAMHETFEGTTGFFDTPEDEFFNLVNVLRLNCFLEGSKIETERGIVNVENLRKGDMIKTFRDGYRPIKYLGVRTISHLANPERIADQLYLCPKENFPGATDDLVITGCHSLLIYRLFKDEHEKKEVIRVNGHTYVTDGHYRFPACILTEETRVYPHKGTFNIYHFALENDDYFMNYGVYAGGILVETASIRYMKELANMRLIGGTEDEETEDMVGEVAADDLLKNNQPISV